MKNTTGSICLLILLMSISCKSKIEETKVVQSGDTLFYADKFDKNGKNIVFYIENQPQPYQKDTIIKGNQELNNKVSYRFLKTPNGFVKSEVLPYETLKEEYYVTFENDTVKCGEDLVVRVKLSQSKTIDFQYGGKHYLSEKLGDNFKIRVKTNCNNKDIQTFNAKLNYLVEGFEEGDAEIEFNYYVK